MSKSFYHLNEVNSIYLDSMKNISSKLIYGEQVMCSFLEIEPNTIVPMHSHKEEQITIIFEGSIEFTVNNETKMLGPGDVVIQPSMAPHGAVVGPSGVKGMDVFSPIRNDLLNLLHEQKR